MRRLEQLALRGDLDALRGFLREAVRRGEVSRARVALGKGLEAGLRPLWGGLDGSATIDPLKVLAWATQGLYAALGGTQVPLSWEAEDARLFAADCAAQTPEGHGGAAWRRALVAQVGRLGEGDPRGRGEAGEDSRVQSIARLALKIAQEEGGVEGLKRALKWQRRRLVEQLTRP